MESYLVITALGTDKPGIVDKLSETVVNCSCNIIEEDLIELCNRRADSYLWPQVCHARYPDDPL